uniref:Uncharacterized protein n=1 Tax=Mus musculus TaxID=10090 RepID=Q8BIS6_MOUSE|nr:unnamed protein product [Mus musculus]
MDLGVASHRCSSCRPGMVLGCVAWAKGSLKHKQGEDAVLLKDSSASHCGGGASRKLLRRQDITSLPCPLPVPGGLPWSLGWVQQAHPLGCAWYVCVGRTCPAGAVNSFPPCSPNLPHLSLCPFK